MRYSVISKGLTVPQLQDEVKRCGGRNLKVALASKQIFCELDDAGVARLKATGCSVNKIGGVRADVMPPIITPPTPVAAMPIYTPEEFLTFAGFEEIRSLFEPPIYGEGFNLAVIGTGIRETHKRINGRVVYRKNYTTDPMRDEFDHDTGVCDIVVTLAPSCNILNMKVLNNKGEGSEEDVALAIDDCISLHDTQPGIAPSVINLSLGSPDEGNPDDPLRVACRAAIDKGIWVIASAGNMGPSPYTITCPACERYVAAVGSVGPEPFAISEWSSRGPTLEGLIKPDGVFLGENIIVASSESDTATAAKSGTSFAAPFGSAVSLLYHEGITRHVGWVVEIPGLYPEVTLQVPIQGVLDTRMPNLCVKPAGEPLGKDNNYGHGMPFGPLIAQAIARVPGISPGAIVEGLVPLLALGMLGIIISPMIKGFK